MKLATVCYQGHVTYGEVVGDELADLGAVLGPALPTLKSVLAAGALAACAAARDAAPRLPLAACQWLPPIPNPGKILCVGLNYDLHRQETGRDAHPYPTLFTRFADTLVGHDQPMRRPTVSAKFDYEGELALILGRPAWRLEGQAARDAVVGYAAFNDGSVRDFQNHTTQFTPGKNFPATAGFGPWLVTADEMGAIGPQPIETRLNAQIVQQARLSDMIFDVAAIIAYVSRFTPLSPGDVIATGTPAGVGAKRQPPLWMKPGDVVEVTIGGLGSLRNLIADEAPV